MHTCRMGTFQNSELISCNVCVKSKNYFTLGPLTTSATVGKDAE